MSQVPLIKATPWDALAFGMPTWELLEYSAAALQQSTQATGHYTCKVHPLADKRLLHESGFYYCDTLIEPHCNVNRLRVSQHPDASISKEIGTEEVLAICHEAFSHGRFHRDFNLIKAAADLRYDNWLKQLIEAQQVYGLYWQGALASLLPTTSPTISAHPTVM